MKALEKDRNRRYETANGLAADVRRYLDDEPVQACPPSAWYRFGKLARRNRAALTTAILVSLALIAGTAVSAWQAFRATEAERRTAAALAEAQRRATESQAVVDFFLLKDLIAASPYQHQGSKPTVEEVLARADVTVEGRFLDQPRIKAAIHHVLGCSYAELGSWKKAEWHLNRAIALRRTHLGPEHPDTLASLYAGTSLLHVRDRLHDVERQKKAAALAQQVVDARRRVLGPDHPDTVESLELLAFILRVAGRPDEALALFQQTYDAQLRRWGPEHPNTLKSLNGLALAHWSVGRREESIDLLKRVVALRSRVQAPGHPDVLWSLNDLVRLLGHMGRFEEAAQFIDQSLDRGERVFGPYDGNTGWAFGWLHRTLKGLGRWDDLRVTLERWLAKLVRLTPDQDGRATDPELKHRRAERLNQLVWLLVTLPDSSRIDVQACVRAAQEAVELMPTSAAIRNTLGVAYYRAGDGKAAIEALEKAEALNPDKDFALNGFFLAMAHWQLGDRDRARSWNDRAVAWMDKNSPQNDELKQFRDEAAALLGVNDLPADIFARP
jgi:tetratricopeptide (TPR) repeat protein